MKMRKFAKWTIALALGLSTSPLQSTESIPQNMAAVGDSITAGALAGFKRSDGHNPLVLFKLLYYIGKVGYKRSLLAFESRGRSWATGDSRKVRTHFNRLRELNDGEKLAAYNAAVSGSTSHNIKDQIDHVLSWSNKNLAQGSPDYVLIGIGSNDACQNNNSGMTSAATYANNVRNAVFRVLDANPNAKVMISGIPNLVHLRNVAENSWLGAPPLTTCKDMWATHNFCNNVLLEKDRSKLEEVTKRLWEYQDELEFIRRDANARFGFDRVRFSYEVYNYGFSDDDISIDCFHPNTKGQQILADVTWKKSWWKNLAP